MAGHIQWNQGPVHMSTDITTAIKVAEQARCAAMLANDNAALAALLDPRLQFHHATGAVDDKQAYMAKMAAGRIQYIAINWSEENIIALGDGAAVLTGRMNTDVRVEGIDKALANRVTTVWSLNDGDWQIVAFQSTPMAA
jgi:Domain of unknown function (DUF4440)